MIVNREMLLSAAPIRDMERTKIHQEHGVSYGLSEAGYDIRLKQEVRFSTNKVYVIEGFCVDITDGHFALGSSVEYFQMPEDLVGIVHDKSTWARERLSVFNTVIEPGWCGYLTLELVYHGNGELILPAGTGIAQVVFHQTTCDAAYNGKYQNQEDKPVESRFKA